MAHWTITLGGTTLRDPTDSEIAPMWTQAQNIGISGTSRRKVMHRKYKYTLGYKNLTTTEYDALEAIVNALDPVTLVYDKFPQAESPGISVLAELSKRDIGPYNGVTDYYSNVKLTLTEISAR